jgi:hypothetical protein
MQLMKVAVLLGLAHLSASCVPPHSHPSDAELIESFRSRRPALEQLRAMILEEQHVTLVASEAIALDCQKPVGGKEAEARLPSARHRHYLELLAAAGLRAVQRRPTGAVDFWVTWHFFLTDDYRPQAKGYQWTPKPLTRRVWPSIDDPLNAETADEGFFRVQRQIAPEWYLQYTSGSSHRVYGCAGAAKGEYGANMPAAIRAGQWRAPRTANLSRA